MARKPCGKSIFLRRHLSVLCFIIVANKTQTTNLDPLLNSKARVHEQLVLQRVVVQLRVEAQHAPRIQRVLEAIVETDFAELVVMEKAQVFAVFVENALIVLIVDFKNAAQGACLVLDLAGCGGGVVRCHEQRLQLQRARVLLLGPGLADVVEGSAVVLASEIEEPGQAATAAHVQVAGWWLHFRR